MSNEKFYMVYGVIFNVSFPILIYSILGLCYYAESPFIERYKCLEEAWPWKEDPEAWSKLRFRTICLASFNMFILQPAAYAPFHCFDLPLDLDFSASGIPDATKMCLQVLFCMVMEDMTFHCSHRFLHLRWIYPWVHKIHHEHKVTIGMASHYAHPLEFVFGNLLPCAVGPIILGTRLHITVALTWYVLRNLESIEGHCGYEFSWSPFRVLPFGSDFAYHAYHHSHNIGNYSSFFTYWDTVFGSNKVYYQYLDERRQEEQAKTSKVKNA